MSNVLHGLPIGYKDSIVHLTRKKYFVKKNSTREDFSAMTLKLLQVFWVSFLGYLVVFDIFIN